MVWVFAVTLCLAGLGVLVVVSRDAPASDGRLTPATIELLGRYVAELRDGVEVLEAGGGPDEALLPRLEGAHAQLRALPVAERVRALAVLTWAAHFLRFPDFFGPLLLRWLGVTSEQARSAAVPEAEARQLRELALELASPGLPRP